MTKAKRSTTVRDALTEAVADARGAGRMTPGLEVQALLADKLAAVVDVAESSELPQAVAQLQRALSVLPLEAPGPVSGDGVDDERVRVLRALDGPPQVGNAANA